MVRRHARPILGILGLVHSRVSLPAIWFAPIFLNPANLPHFVDAPFHRGQLSALSEPLLLTNVFAVAALTAGLASRRGRLAYAVLAMPALAAVMFLTQPNVVTRSAQRDDADARDLAAWAMAHTAPDALFQFADAGHSTMPGIFRVEAQRALYADWKTGGQVNQSWAFAREWERRWEWQRRRESAGRAAMPQLPVDEYRAAGVDYVVLDRTHRLANARAVYENADWRVYALTPSAR